MKEGVSDWKIEKRTDSKSEYQMREKKMNAGEKKENHSNRAEKSEFTTRIFLLSLLTSHVNTQTDYTQLGVRLIV